MSRRRARTTAAVAAAALLAGLDARDLRAADLAPLEDNSFLIEEAYNQERGVVQHISNFARVRGSGVLVGRGTLALVPAAFLRGTDAERGYLERLKLAAPENFSQKLTAKLVSLAVAKTRDAPAA